MTPTPTPVVSGPIGEVGQAIIALMSSPILQWYILLIIGSYGLWTVVHLAIRAFSSYDPDIADTVNTFVKTVEQSRKPEVPPAPTHEQPIGHIDTGMDKLDPYKAPGQIHSLEEYKRRYKVDKDKDNV
jgi:hypothetical protein